LCLRREESGKKGERERCWRLRSEKEKKERKQG